MKGHKSLRTGRRYQTDMQLNNTSIFEMCAGDSYIEPSRQIKIIKKVPLNFKHVRLKFIMLSVPLEGRLCLFAT